MSYDAHNTLAVLAMVEERVNATISPSFKNIKIMSGGSLCITFTVNGKEEPLWFTFDPTSGVTGATRLTIDPLGKVNEMLTIWKQQREKDAREQKSSEGNPIKEKDDPPSSDVKSAA